ncbi:tape measure chaperone [Bacillus phage Silence]|nr:tape measure chaperone [Bacillus phage Silence]
MSLNAYVKVKLAGEDRYLKFDVNAACELEEMFDKGIAGILREEQIGFKLVRAFYYIGLKWKYKNLTLENTGLVLQKEIEEGNSSLPDLMKPVMDALTKSRLLGSPKKGQAEIIDADTFKVDEDENDKGALPGFEETDSPK